MELNGEWLTVVCGETTNVGIKWSENRLRSQLMNKTFTLLFLFAWVLMIVGYLLGMLEVPATMFLINLLFG